MQHWVHSFRHHWVTSNQWQRANEAANQSSHFRHHKTKPHKQQPYRNPDFASFKLFFFSLSPCPAVSNKCCKRFSAWQARAPTLVDCLFQFLWCSTTQLSQNFSKMTQKHPVLTQQLALKLSVQLFSCPSVWFHLYLLDIQKRFCKLIFLLSRLMRSTTTDQEDILKGVSSFTVLCSSTHKSSSRCVKTPMNHVSGRIQLTAYAFGVTSSFLEICISHPNATSLYFTLRWTS